VVEDPDLARAVMTLRDRALEGPVLERVDLGLDREALLALRGGEPFRNRPRGQASVAFQSDVVVQSRRTVLMDHERVAGAGLVPGSRLGRSLGSERAPADVLEQRRILGREGDLVRGLVADVWRGGPGEGAANRVVFLDLDPEGVER